MTKADTLREAADLLTHDADGLRNAAIDDLLNGCQDFATDNAIRASALEEAASMLRDRANAEEDREALWEYNAKAAVDKARREDPEGWAEYIREADPGAEPEFKPGDRVGDAAGEDTGTVVSVEGRHLQIRWDTGEETREHSDLMIPLATEPGDTYMSEYHPGDRVFSATTGAKGTVLAATVHELDVLWDANERSCVSPGNVRREAVKNAWLDALETEAFRVTHEAETVAGRLAASWYWGYRHGIEFAINQIEAL